MKKSIFIIPLLIMSTFSFARDITVLSWSDCVREAARNNPDLAASLQNIRQYKALKWIAKSPFLPQITADSSANKSDNFSSELDRNKYDYSIQGEQLIFDGFKTYNDVKSAKENIAAAEFSSSIVASDVRYNLKKAFVELLKAQAMVPIADEIIQRRKQNLDMIRLRYESGREHEGSLLLAEANLKQAQYDLRKAKRDISVAQYELRTRMGWENNIPVKVEGGFELSGSGKDEPDIRLLAGNHPRVKMSKAEKESARYGVESAKAEFFPEVSVNAQAGKVGVGISSEDTGWSVGLGASLPIFEGGRRIANTQKARAELREAVSNERSEYDKVLSALEYAWQGLKDAIEEVSVRQSYLEAAGARARIARAQYANGLLIFDNWIIIEDNYINAQKSFLETQADMLIAEAMWVNAKGGTLDDE